VRGLGNMENLTRIWQLHNGMRIAGVVDRVRQLESFFCNTSFLKLELFSSSGLTGREKPRSGGLVEKKCSLSLSSDRNYLTNQVQLFVYHRGTFFDCQHFPST
jgi:hypothetical protein